VAAGLDAAPNAFRVWGLTSAPPGPGRSGNPKVAWVVEAIKCFVLGFYPRVINRESYYILRASFRRTHRQHSRWNFFK
jgi:hypothetical protein